MSLMSPGSTWLRPARRAMAGRNHVMPDDIKDMRYGILRHRIIRTFDALADNVSIEGLIDAVFNAVPVP